MCKCELSVRCVCACVHVCTCMQPEGNASMLPKYHLVILLVHFCDRVPQWPGA